MPRRDKSVHRAKKRANKRYHDEDMFRELSEDDDEELTEDDLESIYGGAGMPVDSDPYAGSPERGKKPFS